MTYRLEPESATTRGWGSKSRAFTLIELLIVVAIIAILAAIAVPNFLEAQTRAKIARVESDMRTIALGIQSYTVDNNKTPYLYEYYLATSPNMYNAYIYHHFDPNVSSTVTPWHQAIRLTTPVAYLDTIAYTDPFDSFGESNGGLDKAGYICLSLQGALADGKHAQNWQTGALLGTNTQATYPLLAPMVMKINGQARNFTFFLVSPGPDKKWDVVNGVLMTPSHAIPEEPVAYAYVNGLINLYDPTNGTASGGEILRIE
ncbi:prepilin-type N-terminal cleavage/methylation domain-containing protein [bacterium]|nr:prepilin-type N-terminal cleavage/methylation domain-containing protein [bacterium]